MPSQPKYYSLLDYTFTITAVDADSNSTFASVTLGGTQGYLGGATIVGKTDNITQQSDATGGVIYEFSNDHTATITFELSFVATALDNLLKFIRESYVITSTGAVDSWKKATFTIDVFKIGLTGPIVSNMGCMLRRIPNWEVEATSGTRTYEFYVAKKEEYNSTERSSTGA